MPSEGEKDRRLVRSLAEGDATAWSEFIRRYIRLVVHVVRETLYEKTGRATEEDIDDITEEVYAHLVDRNCRVFSQLHEPYNLKAWIATVTRRKALDHCKKRMIRSVSLDQSFEEQTVLLERLIGQEHAAPGEKEEIQRVLEQAPLNSKERRLITLSFFQEQSYAEISDSLRMPENSVGPTLHRALEKVKDTLRQREP
jgi:RNA polymerase sigma-70 factor (ECF subfamily)